MACRTGTCRRLTARSSTVSNLRALRNSDFDRLLKGGALDTTPLLAVEDIAAAEIMAAELPDPIGDAAADEGLAIQQLSLPALPAAMVVEPQRFPAAPPEVNIGGMTVRFDGHSHSSGLQRGYVRCPSGAHHRCFKYRQVVGFYGWRDCAAWLACWAVKGQHEVNKHDHGAFEPYPQDVAAAKAEILQ